MNQKKRSAYSQQSSTHARRKQEKKKCIFTTILNSCPGGEKSFSPKPLSDYCLGIVIQSSKERGDGFATNFQIQSSELPTTSIPIS